jgi:hypothetical protein
VRKFVEGKKREDVKEQAAGGYMIAAARPVNAENLFCGSKVELWILTCIPILSAYITCRHAKTSHYLPPGLNSQLPTYLVVSGFSLRRSVGFFFPNKICMEYVNWVVCDV